MEKQNFIDSVKYLSRPDDFKKDSHKLDEVKPRLYEAFLKCLKHGGHITPSVMAVNQMDKISRETTLTPMDCANIMAQFRWINALIDMKPEPVQETNNSKK